MSDLDDCLNKGLLKRIAPSEENAKKSVAKAKRWLARAKELLDSEFYDNCLISSYAAMFHAARAVLLKDGFRERSHYCIARYLDEKYAKEGKLDTSIVDILDRYRELRHEDFYSIDFDATSEEAKESIASARLLIKALERIIRST